jgi:hypothetical protein
MEQSKKVDEMKQQYKLTAVENKLIREFEGLTPRVRMVDCRYLPAWSNQCLLAGGFSLSQTTARQRSREREWRDAYHW